MFIRKFKESNFERQVSFARTNPFCTKFWAYLNVRMQFVLHLKRKKKRFNNKLKGNVFSKY